MKQTKRDELDAKGIVVMTQPVSADLRHVWLTSFATSHAAHGLTGSEAAETAYTCLSAYLEWCASVKARTSPMRLEEAHAADEMGLRESKPKRGARGPKR